MESKVIIYQVFTRLFGNKKTLQKPWGTQQENGVGKFSDFTEVALQSIKTLGVTHIWFTGVIRHAMCGDMYLPQGIEGDDARIVKGRAGSPYAIKDYYDVNPDLADEPAMRMQEFEQLIKRVHRMGLKVIIDLVPNHLARNYKSIAKPAGVRDFGEDDNTSVAYSVNNNFYYIPYQSFVFADVPLPMRVLIDEQSLAFGQGYTENPARWTGNGSRNAKPSFTDWYETVKLNFGISPTGEKDFPCLDSSFEWKSYQEHYTFWQDKTVPDTWQKFKDIAMYWLEKGIDGFRYDMAELVPVEFWSYLNSAIKNKNPNVQLIAEVYNTELYRSYIRMGKMEYLYDKVQLYDTLRHIIQYQSSTDILSQVAFSNEDISQHMLGFLENHDEQRIASPFFADRAEKAKPAMVFLTTMRSSPVMIYFGQEVGEPAQEKAGFGSVSRTSIFDYIAVPYHQRWMNNGAFDGGLLTEGEKHLRDFYARVLHLTVFGSFIEIHQHNRTFTEFYNDRVYSFLRSDGRKTWLIVCNFSSDNSYGFSLQIPEYALQRCNLSKDDIICTDLLYGIKNKLRIEGNVGFIRVDVAPLQSFVYELDV